MYAIDFEAGSCTCPHPEPNHDDGFGCTVPGCECIAGFIIADEDGDS